MIERDLEPDFPPAAQQELAAISGPAGATADVRDVRDRLPRLVDRLIQEVGLGETSGIHGRAVSVILISNRA